MFFVFLTLRCPLNYYNSWGCSELPANEKHLVYESHVHISLHGESYKINFLVLFSKCNTTVGEKVFK